MDHKHDDLTNHFLYVEGLFHRLHAHRFRSFGPGGNPLRGQGRVLSILKLQPEISQKELGYLLDMRNQSLGEILKKLEKNGYITRTPSEKDRRTMNIKLTEAGRAAAEKSDSAQKDEYDIFSCMTEEERDQMRKLLDKLAAALEARTAELGDDRRGWNFGHFPGDFGGRPSPPPRSPHGPHDFGPGGEDPRVRDGGPDRRFGDGHGPFDQRNFGEWFGPGEDE